MSNVSVNVLGDVLFDYSEVDWSEGNKNSICLIFSVRAFSSVFNFVT